MRRMILLTQAFPYGRGEGFLSEEIKSVCSAGIDLIIIPHSITETSRPLPAGVTVFTPTISVLSLVQKYAGFMLSSIFWKEVFYKPSFLFDSPGRISFLFFIKMMAVTSLRLRKLDSSINLSSADVIYSYWLSGFTGGAIDYNRSSRINYKMLSRAHGGDLYENRNCLDYLPFRKFLLNNLDYVAVVSGNGADYLRRRYPFAESKIVVHYLGTRDPMFINTPSDDGIVRIVSCSFISPVKRIPFLVDVVNDLSSKNPLKRFEWNHLGGGIDLLKVEAYANEKLTANNITWSIKGDLPNEAILDFYRANPVDLFVSTSSSEGIPVSMMEAMSVGIPVVSTRVGGVRELVGEDQLLAVDSSVGGFADFILKHIEIQHDRNSIKGRWAVNFSAAKTYIKFIERIGQI